ncbi:MAG: ABC transporter permease [Candidatus Lokiarchaeota archaeon]|nr:ABC transporter permease [Candidatus Lokiarchaeota archaeon]
MKGTNIGFKTKISQLWMLIRKNLELYYKKGPVIIFGFIFPFFMTMAWVIGRSIDPVQLFSGILGMTTFFTGTAISPVIFPWETREKDLERILSAPVKLSDLIISITLASTLFSFIVSTIISTVLIFVLSINIWVIGWVLMGNLLLAWISSSLGVLISSPPTDLTADIMMIANLVKFPLIFISGIFIPLSLLPQAFVILSFISPITYFVDLLTSSLGTGFIGISIDVIVMVSLAIMIHLLAHLLHRKTLLKRF